MKRWLSLALAVMLCLAGTARAENTLDWYYNHRFALYREYEPEKHEAILAGVRPPLHQSCQPIAGLEAWVEAIAWAPQVNLMVIAFATAPEDPSAAELHPLMNLDADGAYIGLGETTPMEDEFRREHWLWTDEDCGPAEEMIAPGKALYLLDACEVWLGDYQLLGDGCGWDAYRTEDGVLHTVMEIRLDRSRLALLQAGAVQNRVALQIPFALIPYNEIDESSALHCLGGIDFSFRIE